MNDGIPPSYEAIKYNTDLIGHGFNKLNEFERIDLTAKDAKFSKEHKDPHETSYAVVKNFYIEMNL